MIDKCLVEPTRLTTTQRDALSLGASDAAIIYNVTTDQHEFWSGAAWVPFDHPLVVREFVGSTDITGNTTAMASDFTTTLIDRGHGLIQSSGSNGIQVLQAGVYRIITEFTFQNGGSTSQMAFGYNVNNANDILITHDVRPTEDILTHTAFSFVRVVPLAANDILRCRLRRLTNSGTSTYTEYSLSVGEA